MRPNGDFDRIAQAWLAEGPSVLADRVLDAALDEVHLTDQRRRVTPWRTPAMPTFVRLAAAAVIGVVAIGVIYLNLPGQGTVGGPTPTPSPAPSASPATSEGPAAIEAPIPSLTETFESANGYSIGIGAGMTVGKTGAPWGQPDGFDAILTNLYVLRVGSDAVPDGVELDTWIRSRLTAGTPQSCGAIRADLPDVVIDGATGKIRESCDEIEATVVTGGRAYLFTMFMEDPPLSNGRAIFDAFAATVQFRPEAVPSPS